MSRYECWSLILGAAGLVISLFVGIIVGWYAWETQKLRQQSEDQTSLLRNQLSVSTKQAKLFAEQVASSIRPFVMCEVESLAPGGSFFPSDHPMRAVKAVCRGKLWNPTERVAHDLRVLVHNQHTGYYWSDEPPVLRKPGEATDWIASGPIDREAALKLPEHVYGSERVRSQRSVLEQNGNHDYLAVFFAMLMGTSMRTLRFSPTWFQETIDYGYLRYCGRLAEHADGFAGVRSVF